MVSMVVTLDVSKLSGWLNADADCRVERRAYDMRSEVCAGGGRAWAGGSARAACTGRGPGCEGWGGALSGWLNADARCRVERRVCDAERGVGRETGERGPAAAHERHARREGPALKAGRGYRACAERTQNMPFMVVTLNVSKLSGWLNADASCRVVRRACTMRGEVCGPGTGGRGPAAAQERHARREGPALKAGRGYRACAERTWNM
eukprot:scaffold21758_cov46-Phaeocystis_antarctica.AAC.4